MDNSVEQITALANQAALEMNETPIPAVIIAGNNQLQSLEHLLTEPVLFRAKLTTRFIEQFTTYVNDNNGANVFISESALSAEGIFDLGTKEKPEWGNHRAILTLQKEPEYDAVLRVNTHKKSQENIIDFIEDYMENITFYSDDKVITIKDSINRIRRIKVNASKETTSDHGNFNQSHSALESVEVKSDGNTLPDSFIFECRPYADMQVRTIYCKLRAHISSDGIHLSYRIVGANKLEQELTNEFCELISDQLDTESTVTIGRMTYQGS